MAQQRKHEAPQIGAMVERMFKALVRRAGEGEEQALEVLSRLERVAANAVRDGGRAAHFEADYSWTQIGEFLGVSRQAARQRCGLDTLKAVHEDDPAQPSMFGPVLVYGSAIDLTPCIEAGRHVYMTESHDADHCLPELAEAARRESVSRR
jgi:hypothetical protein